MSTPADGRYELSDKKQLLLRQLMRAEGLSSRGSRSIVRRNEDGPAPLSFAQQRLWFLDQLAPGTPFYSIAQAIRYRVPLDASLLERSLNEILRRHAVLRSRIVVIEGEPRQVVTPPEHVALPVLDLRTVPEHEREAEAIRLAVGDAHRPFDMAVGPLVRASVLQLGDSDYVLLLHVHHIVCDGWSLGILFREMAQFYDAFAQRRPADLPEPPIQYADYAVWQRGWLTGPVLQEQFDYWRRQLAGLPALEMPLDRPRPPTAGYRGGHVIGRIDHDVTQALRDLGARERSTLFMVLLAGFGVLLARYSGQEDFAVGTPTAGRNRTEVENLIGFFINILVLRLDVSGEPTFRDLLGRVRSTALDAYAHQDLPFEKLVEDLQPERSLSRNPLFQVSFQLLPSQPTPASVTQNVTQLPVEKKVALFDLSLDIGEEANGLVTIWEYDDHLFTAATVERMSDQFVRLLRAIVDSPDDPIWKLPLSTQTELHQMLVQWNDTGTDGSSHASVIELWESQALLRPNAPAVIGRHETWTFGELDRQSNRLADYLGTLGVEREMRVGICLDHGLRVALAVLGVLKAGGAYVPLDPGLPQERLAFIIKDTGLRVVLTQSTSASPLPEVESCVCLDRDWPLIAKASGGQSVSRPRASDLAYVLYTSGSTGQPKGVMVEHGALADHALTVAQVYGLGAGDRVFGFAPLAFDVAAEEMFPTWACGAAVVPRVTGLVMSIPDLVRTFDDLGVTVANLPTSYWHEWSQALADGHLTCPGSLRLAVVGSEPMRPGWFAQWRTHAPQRPALIHAYGSTESVITSLLHAVPEAAVEDPVATGLPIGRPIANVQAYVLDRHQQPVPIGVPGELYLGGTRLARGYLNQPGLTAMRFVPDPFGAQPGARLYRTGDRVRYLADGALEFLGRLDQQVKVRAFRVELGEIEAVLRQHPGVQDGVVEARESTRGATRLVGYVVYRPGYHVDAIGVQQYLRERLPEYMVPSGVIALDRLPRTATGKIDRRALPTDDPVSHGTERQLPASETERMLAGIWQEVLGLGAVGRNENFFDLGGHSLLLVRVHAKLHSLFGVDLALVDMFRYPTIGTLAQHLRGDRPADDAARSRIEERARKQRAALARRR